MFEQKKVRSDFCAAIEDGIRASPATNIPLGLSVAEITVVLEQVSEEVSSCFGKPVRFYLERAECKNSVHLSVERKGSFFRTKKTKYLGLISLESLTEVKGSFKKNETLIEFGDANSFESAFKEFLRAPETGAAMSYVLS